MKPLTSGRGDSRVADKDIYLRSGKTISEDRYLRYPQGPVSEHLLEALRELEAERKIFIRKERVIAYEQYIFISLAEPDVSQFTGEDVSAMSRAIALISPLTAQQASFLSHDHTWEIFDNKEEIPMYAVLAAEIREFKASDMAWAEP